MTRYVVLIFIGIFFSLVYVQAQPMITKETKVLLVMDLEGKDFEVMELFNDQSNIEALKSNYPGHGIYIGLMQGGYELSENRIRPEENAVITIYTDQQLFAGNLDFPSDDFPLGREFKMHGNGIMVVSNKKGELILKME